MTLGVAIVSGGMDSAVLAHQIRGVDGDELIVVSFDYGQRHARELGYAARIAEDVHAVAHHVIDLHSLGAQLTGSALTDRNVPVPHGHYAAETMRQTVVPNRNAVMITCATGIAVARGASYVALGVHAGDHAVYPDCRPEFIAAMTHAMRVANEGFIADDFTIRAPFLALTKTDIARAGARLGVDFSRTWSCYEGGVIHCGACGTCVERREAMRDAGIDDPTIYAAVPLFDAP